MIKEKLVSNIFTDNLNGTRCQIKVKVIDYCDANYQKRQEDFYIFHLNTLQPNRLNIKRAQK